MLDAAAFPVRCDCSAFLLDYTKRDDTKIFLPLFNSSIAALLTSLGVAMIMIFYSCIHLPSIDLSICMNMYELNIIFVCKLYATHYNNVQIIIIFLSKILIRFIPDTVRRWNANSVNTKETTSIKI